jgi:medium-chain acyl-[acyl-carrier-protein] hydrolase
MRDFEVADAAGTPIVAGSSAWLVVDAASKRPQRLNALLAGLEGLYGNATLSRDPVKLEACDDWGHAFSVAVRYDDIDVNRHVNSGRYIDWMLDAYPLQFHRDHCLRVLEVNFLGETLEGDVLNVRTRQDRARVYLHALTKIGGPETCRARLEWETTPPARSVAG